MMVKVEEDPAPELPPSPPPPAAATADDGADGYDDDDDGDDYEDDDEEDEETDSDEGDEDGAARGGEAPLKKGPWTPDEDKRLRDYVEAHGGGNWNQVRINAGLNRCGKSCRLRWANHLRPDLKREPFDDAEVDKIIRMHMTWGNRWARMASCLPGRTDNEIKNFWNTRLKRHQRAGLPIYPEYLVSQATKQDMNFDNPQESHGKKRRNELSSENVLDISDLINEYFDNKVFSKCVRAGDLPSTSLLNPNTLPIDAMNPSKRRATTGCIASDYNALSCVHIPDESEKASCSTSFNHGMAENQLAPLGNTIFSGHPIFDGNPSTSWTIQRPMKMELPSVQYSNYGLSNAWGCECPSGSPIEKADTFIESPGSLKSESISSQNTGLDAIVHKGDGIDDPMKSQGVFDVSVPPFSYNQVSQSNAYSMRHSFPSVPGDGEIEGCPFGELHDSKSPSSSDAIFAFSNGYPDTRFSGKYLPSWADTGALDTSLEASLSGERSLFSKDQSIIFYNSFIDEDSCEEAKLSTAGHGLDSFTWNSMPSACNMSDFPNL